MKKTSRELLKLAHTLASIEAKIITRRLRKQNIAPKLIRSIGPIQLRIYKERNHALPHFHLNYKREHKASYEISSCKRLAGIMPAKYEKAILSWALKNKSSLLKEWQELNAGCRMILEFNTQQDSGAYAAPRRANAAHR